MDEPRIDYPRTIAGLLAIIALLTAGILLGRCSAPAAASEPQKTPIPLTLDQATSVGYDFENMAGRALTELQVFLDSVTTTTVSSQMAANPEAAPTAPTNMGDRWDQLAECETGGNWAANTGNGYGGGLQFAHTATWSTWISYGGAEYAPHPWEASREQQIAVAENVLARSGWNAWPGCSRKNGWN